MMCCDLCGKTASCLQKEIEGKEFDICERCWHPLAEKLSGKGRLKDSLEAELEEYEETTV
jgi:ribosome-binding protein aMBF1 (putative translation factor)